MRFSPGELLSGFQLVCQNEIVELFRIVNAILLVQCFSVLHVSIHRGQFIQQLFKFMARVELYQITNSDLIKFSEHMRADIIREPNHNLR